LPLTPDKCTVEATQTDYIKEPEMELL